MADFRFQLLIRGNLARYMDRLPMEYARSTTTVLRRKGRTLKNALRRDVTRAGLGTRLGNAIRDQVFPVRGYSMRARGRVFSRALVSRGGRRFDLIALFNAGAVIRPRRSRFLAIPTAEAGTRRSTAQWPRGSLFVVATGRAPYLAHVDQPTVPLFILVRQVRLRQRLHVDAIAARTLRNTNVLLARDMERRASRLAKRLSA